MTSGGEIYLNSAGTPVNFGFVMHSHQKLVIGSWMLSQNSFTATNFLVDPSTVRKKVFNLPKCWFSCLPKGNYWWDSVSCGFMRTPPHHITPWKLMLHAYSLPTIPDDSSLSGGCIPSLQYSAFKMLSTSLDARVSWILPFAAWSPSSSASDSFSSIDKLLEGEITLLITDRRPESLTYWHQS